MNLRTRSLQLLCAMACSLAFAACTPAQAKSDQEAPPIHVQTVDVSTVDAPVMLRLTGTLKGSKDTDLAANASGRVTKTFVERGDDVKEGTIVAQLDTSAANLNLAEARVQVDTSKTQEDINQADCARYEQLRQKGVISALEYDQATAKCKTAPLGLEVARARQSIAAKSVGDGTIRAPFSGVVSERYVEVGEYVQPSSKVVSIVQSSEVRLELAVPEANVAQIKVGADVTFFVAAYPNKPFHGSVKFISGALRPTTRDLLVEAVVDNADKSLRPGMFADVSLTVGTQKLASVPTTSVFERQDKKRVYVLVGGRLEERVLQYGLEIDGGLSVESGVKPGDKVVVGDLGSLQNGARAE